MPRQSSGIETPCVGFFWSLRAASWPVGALLSSQTSSRTGRGRSHVARRWTSACGECKKPAATSASASSRALARRVSGMCRLSSRLITPAACISSAPTTGPNPYFRSMKRSAHSRRVKSPPRRPARPVRHASVWVPVRAVAARSAWPMVAATARVIVARPPAPFPLRQAASFRCRPSRSRQAREVHRLRRRRDFGRSSS